MSDAVDVTSTVVVPSMAVVGSTGVVASFVVEGSTVVKRAVVVAGSVVVKTCHAVDVISTVGLTVVVASLAVVD